MKSRFLIGGLVVAVLRPKPILSEQRTKILPIQPIQPLPPSKLRLAMRTMHLTTIFLPLGLLFPFWYLFNTDFKSTWWLKLVRKALEHLGPLFIKLGQWVSCKTDTFPPKVCEEFANLQSKIKPHSIEFTNRVIQDASGKSIEEIFSAFDPVPIGVGSVAQVYKGVLCSTGDEVAVKVLHPLVEKQILLDLAILESFGSILHRLPFFNLQYLGIPQEIKTFHEMLLKQTDLRIEKKNLEKFKYNFKDEELLTIPTVLAPDLNTNELLIESLEPGLTLHSFLINGPTAYDAYIAEKGVKCLAKMMLHDNFIHADLHSGNILVSFLKPIKSWKPFSKVTYEKLDSTRFEMLLDNRTSHDDWLECISNIKKEGYQANMILLDCGLTNSLLPKNLKTVKDCFKAGLEYDGEALANLFISRSKFPDRVIDKPGMVRKMVGLIENVSVDDRGQILISKFYGMDVVRNFTNLIRSHRITLDGDFSGLFVAGLISEGIGRTLNADLDLFPVLVDYLMKANFDFDFDDDELKKNVY
jgi:aarF domain-containing kinase